jgi:site-specific DNA-methyltransferase (adenine-specific)
MVITNQTGTTMSHQILLGDCRDRLKELPDNSIDSIVTDPPYELGFMGKSWDASGVAYDVTVWQECLRVLKPGGHLLSFGGSRTYHRMACAIEDAGFQIRDQIMWVYGSGFPKSLNISKAIDKAAGAEREVVGSKLGQAGYHLQGHSSSTGAFNHGLGSSTLETRLASSLITAPATAEAKEWQGWGTALKPAHEPIVLARKPIVGTVANNVLTHGTGGINIDGCRVGNESVQTNRYNAKGDMTSFHGSQAGNSYVSNIHEGRFPANFIHDGSDEVLQLFPDTKGGTWNTTKGARHFNNDGEPTGYATSKSDSSSGSAARFFYCAKASKKDRNEGLDQFEEKRDADRTKDDGAGGDNPRNRSNTAKLNHHPTVKPTDLMRYLCRMITPPNGIVLDPFTGSGSTGKAAVLEGFSFIGVEQSEEYIAIAEARIQSAKEDK